MGEIRSEIWEGFWTENPLKGLWREELDRQNKKMCACERSWTSDDAGLFCSIPKQNENTRVDGRNITVNGGGGARLCKTKPPTDWDSERKVSHVELLSFNCWNVRWWTIDQKKKNQNHGVFEMGFYVVGWGGLYWRGRWIVFICGQFKQQMCGWNDGL